MRLRAFSQGLISKKIPPDFHVIQYFVVCAPEPLGISLHFVKLQNTGSPPSHKVDTALRKGPQPHPATAPGFFAKPDA
jgi:hypothetical protein